MTHSFDQYRALLNRSLAHATDYLESLPERPIDTPVSSDTLRTLLGGPLPQGHSDAQTVLDDLAHNIEQGLIGSGGPRYFGYAIGGSFPVALAADWLVSAWDQNVPYYVSSPATSVAEETAAEWLLELLGLPAKAGVGFTSGAQEAIYTAMITARNTLLKRAGWDVAKQGLYEAPRIHVVVSDQIHSTIKRALWMIGMGESQIKTLPTDQNLRIIPEAIPAVLAECDGPTLICAQAGCIDSGAYDPFEALAAAVKAHPNAWLHVDGAIGLWSAASAQQRHLLKGIELADSWDTDGHKWFNMPYDSGVVIVRDAALLAEAMGGNAMGAYLTDAIAKPDRNAINFGIAASRRARGVPVYAAIKTLGKQGIEAHLDNSCRLAKRMADHLSQVEGITILNDVVSNRFSAQFGKGDDDFRNRLTARVVHQLQQDGFCYPSTSGYKGLKTMLFSVLNCHTTEADIDASAERIIAIYQRELARCNDAVPA
ncbi:pyridoxal phosphate-dependent decarboxylase family protein [Ferrimonas balearica]|uniref:pyridoxal phosphate-dependent decarboxylase family protein n=1 Tax=Ferrimonas balearica TaxID=44012 RepID=UPI001C568CCD|nr:pyridoxal-dependent decarboxylase [Ferrimonas balearica]MBW3163224.1 aminotransferase class V-fold PLP-dependent enzyme [Ferrimonas balearica]MBY6223172.1 aminotransferase class V-fold PLP-dependent enzyme [Ferrimonas balearica]